MRYSTTLALLCLLAVAAPVRQAVPVGEPAQASRRYAIPEDVSWADVERELDSLQYVDLHGLVNSGWMRIERGIHSDDGTDEYAAQTMSEVGGQRMSEESNDVEMTDQQQQAFPLADGQHRERDMDVHPTAWPPTAVALPTTKNELPRARTPLRSTVEGTLNALRRGKSIPASILRRITRLALEEYSPEDVSFLVGGRQPVDAFLTGILTGSPGGLPELHLLAEAFGCAIDLYLPDRGKWSLIHREGANGEVSLYWDPTHQAFGAVVQDKEWMPNLGPGERVHAFVDRKGKRVWRAVIQPESADATYLAFARALAWSLA